MTALLIDLGNTRLKWALVDGLTWRADGALTHGERGFFALLTRALAALPDIDAALMVAVANDALAIEIEQALAVRWPAVGVERVVSASAGHGVTLGYAEPSRFGADRYAALIGAHALAPRDQLVVGSGTALTLDVLDSSGRHGGGWIAPGRALMALSLARGTARLPSAQVPVDADFASDTAAGIAAGIDHALAGAVERSARRFERASGERPALMVHGGDADALSARLDRDLFDAVIVRPRLVLEGLARIARS